MSKNLSGSEFAEFSMFGWVGAGYSGGYDLKSEVAQETDAVTRAPLSQMNAPNQVVVVLGCEQLTASCRPSLSHMGVRRRFCAHKAASPHEFFSMTLSHLHPPK